LEKCLFCHLRAAGNRYASAYEPNPNPPQEKNMKRTIIKIVVTTLLLLALGASAVADGVPLPMCYPKPCPVQ